MLLQRLSIPAAPGPRPAASLTASLARRHAASACLWCDAAATCGAFAAVVFNSAGAHVPRLGTACLAAMDAFGLPNCLNLYVTARGTVKSAPPHTDKQDVFVLQSGGAKRWRVYEPPPPRAKPHADPLARGKGEDALDLAELAPPLIDCVLTPGDVLYVPAGYPHTTDTVNIDEAGAAAEADSVHLTIGVDTHIWGLNYASLRTGALDRAGLDDSLAITTLPSATYWQLMRVPPTLGFLSTVGGDAAGGDVAGGDAAGAASTAAERVASELLAAVRAAEPQRWSDHDDVQLAAVLDVPALEAQLRRHSDRVFAVQRAMYLDAARDVLPPTPPGAPRVSVFRVNEHMAQLEAAMDEHLRWYGDAAIRRAVAAAGGGGAPPAAAVAKSGGFGGGGGGGKKKSKPKGGGVASAGFGGGGGASGGKGKGKKAKAKKR